MCDVMCKPSIANCSYVAIRKRDGDRYLVDILIVSPIDNK
jgi:hypothetical protein